MININQLINHDPLVCAILHEHLLNTKRNPASQYAFIC